MECLTYSENISFASLLSDSVCDTWVEHILFYLPSLFSESEREKAFIE